MGRISLRQAALWCGGSVQEKYKEVTFLGANNDSRKIQPGQLFLALQGVRDGHDFIPAALEKGAAAVLCTHCDGDYPAIVVPDVRLALGEIARQERLHLGMKVVGYDDTDLACLTTPPLTTLHQPVEDICRWAVERIVAGESAGEPEAKVFPVRLIHRQSS